MMKLDFLHRIHQRNDMVAVIRLFLTKEKGSLRALVDRQCAASQFGPVPASTRMGT